MEHRHAVNCRFFFTFFYPKKEKGFFQHTVENEVSASSMLTFYKNQLLIGQEGSSLECLNNTNLGQYPRIGMYIIMTAGRLVD